MQNPIKYLFLKSSEGKLNRTLYLKTYSLKIKRELRVSLSYSSTNSLTDNNEYSKFSSLSIAIA